MSTKLKEMYLKLEDIENFSYSRHNKAITLDDIKTEEDAVNLIINKVSTKTVVREMLTSGNHSLDDLRKAIQAYKEDYEAYESGDKIRCRLDHGIVNREVLSVKADAVMTTNFEEVKFEDIDGFADEE